MSVLFIDCETNGLPKNYRAPTSDVRNWPRVVSVAWKLSTSSGDQSQPECRLIKPEGWSIPDDAAELHGITNEMASAMGSPIAVVIVDLLEALKQADLVVAHNFDFDSKVIGCEFIRLGMSDPFEYSAWRCTMKSSVDHCKIPGQYGFKWPKLMELHSALFDAGFEGAHGADFDVLACERCYWKLIELGVIPNESNLASVTK